MGFPLHGVRNRSWAHRLRRPRARERSRVSPSPPFRLRPTCARDERLCLRPLAGSTAQRRQPGPERTRPLCRHLPHTLKRSSPSFPIPTNLIGIDPGIDDPLQSVSMIELAETGDHDRCPMIAEVNRIASPNSLGCAAKKRMIQGSIMRPVPSSPDNRGRGRAGGRAAPVRRRFRPCARPARATLPSRAPTW